MCPVYRSLLQCATADILSMQTDRRSNCPQQLSRALGPYLGLRLRRSRAFTPEPLCVSVRLWTTSTFRTFYFQCWRHKAPVKKQKKQKTSYFLILKFPVKDTPTRRQSRPAGGVTQMFLTHLDGSGSNTLSIIEPFNSIWETLNLTPTRYICSTTVLVLFTLVTGCCAFSSLVG